MSQDQAAQAGPDLTQGVNLSDFKNGKLTGHVGDQEVLLVQSAMEILAIGAHCSHYQGPLVDGLVVGDTVRCPWHHACFSLRTGEAIRAPAFDALTAWQVERDGDRIVVRNQIAPASRLRESSKDEPGRIVIVGGGAAGFATAEMLRRRKFGGSIVMLSQDTAPPADRPNLSKDYLAGSAPEDWLPLRPEKYYRDANIDLRCDVEVMTIDPAKHQVRLSNGEIVPYDRLLLATGAEPVRLPVPGAGPSQIHTLRSLDDCRTIIKAADGAKRALVIGASFIGLEVAASLRAREIEVHVVAPEKRPMERVLGSEMGDFVRALHEEHGVIFHLEDSVERLDGKHVTFESGGALDADLIVAGVGVRPRLALAEAAGLRLDRGVEVDTYLQTSAPDVYAAGDIARWPDPYSGTKIRVEHWVVAERQGQVAALNMIGLRTPFDAVPFFWSQHYDVPINYVGHAEQWDEIAVDGSIKGRDCVVRYKQHGRVLAVASIYRDLASLEAELKMERAESTAA
jgi:NADPH-dependent 2,4-dienoyl-CoA reductase/sulfur reductase-like enzyme/nitrite reductase/ring-hydroxylating ferredoxin subunit